jgi:hypothetical protein
LQYKLLQRYVGQQSIGRVVYYGAAVLLFGQMVYHFKQVKHLATLGADVHFAILVHGFDVGNVYLCAVVGHSVVDYGGYAKGFVLAIAVLYQLFVARLKNVQVQLLAGENDNAERKNGEKTGHV